jgi:hypothetical protein
MKAKAKMPKAMYGKTMMQKGGVKKMQKGGTKKSLPKAQDGKEYDRNIKRKMDADKELEYISNPNQPGMSSNPINTMYGSAGRTSIFEGAPKYLKVRSPYATDADMAGYDKEIAEFYKKNPNIKPYVGSLKTKPVTEIKKKGGATKKKMKTGGMVNSNSKVSALASAGSKGVKSGVNPKASASKVAKGPGKRSSSPKTEIPKAMYGRMMKKGGIKK